MGLDEDNIVDYLHDFNNNHIKPTNHSNVRNFSLNELIEMITIKNQSASSNKN